MLQLIWFRLRNLGCWNGWRMTLCDNIHSSTIRNRLYEDHLELIVYFRSHISFSLRLMTSTTFNKANQQKVRNISGFFIIMHLKTQCYCVTCYRSSFTTMLSITTPTTRSPNSSWATTCCYTTPPSPFSDYFLLLVSFTFRTSSTEPPAILV